MERIRHNMRRQPTDVLFPPEFGSIWRISDFRRMDQVRKVAVIGPECTGKSALSAALAERFETVWVREYAREFLDGLGRAYRKEDLLDIAVGQLRMEDESTLSANGILVCDTNLYVIKVWSDFKFGDTDPRILNMMQGRRYDLYLLTNIDLPWVADPLREHPDRRDELYRIYLDEMKKQPVPFAEIGGVGEERNEMAFRAVKEHLKIA